MSHYTREDVLQTIKARQNLEGKNLAGLDLSHIDFGALSLQRVNLRGANLQKSVFRKTDFRGANLSGADLRGADLHMADLSQARLNGADLSKANLHVARLVEADLRRANLKEANLHGCDFQHANLIKANFEDALLLGSNLGGALLTVSDFRKLDLSQVINSSVKFVDHSLLETEDSSYEEKEEEDVRPIVDETTERLGLKFYVDQQESPKTTQEGMEKSLKPTPVPSVEKLAPISGFERKTQFGKKKRKVAVITALVLSGLVLGIFRLVLTGGSYKGFRMLPSRAHGFIEREVITFKADSGDDGSEDRLWIKFTDLFNQRSVFDHLIRNEKDPRIWEFEIDPHRIKSGNYRLFYGLAKDKLAPVKNAGKVLISVHPPKYALTRILNARGNRRYSLHFIGSFTQASQENTPYLLVKIGPYRMVTVRPEPAQIKNQEVKYRLDVKLNGLRKTDLSENEGYFYEEYLCDRAGHKKLLYKEKSLVGFFYKLAEPIHYEGDSGFTNQAFSTAILPEEKTRLAGVDLFSASRNPGFKLVDKVNESGELELTISRPANLLGRPVYLYLDHRLRGITREATFKDSGRLEGHYYYGVVLGRKNMVYKSNILKMEVAGSAENNEIDIYVKKDKQSDAGGGDRSLTIYQYLDKCKKFAQNFPKDRRTDELITGFFNDYDLRAIVSNFDSLLQLLNKPKYGLKLSGKDFLNLLNQGDLNFEGVCLSYQDVSSLSKTPLNLKGVKLMGANLSFVKLAGANLLRANLNRANLNGADLKRADLGQAMLKNCSLRMADLFKANLGKADLRGADLQGAVLDKAVMDSHTIIVLPAEYETIGNTITKR